MQGRRFCFHVVFYPDMKAYQSKEHHVLLHLTFCVSQYRNDDLSKVVFDNFIVIYVVIC